MDKQKQNIVEEAAETASEAFTKTDEVVDETYDAITGKSKVMKVILSPFKLTWEIFFRGCKFGLNRIKSFSSKFRRFTNYATDDEKGPVTRFTAFLFLRIGILLGIAGGLALQYYVDAVQFVIDLFS